MSAADMSTDGGRRVWRSRPTRTTVLIAAVLIHAVVQSLLVLGDPVPGPSWAFVALTAVSTGALVAFLWLTSCAVGTPARSDGGPRLVELHPAALRWSAALLVTTIAAAWWMPWASLAVVIAGGAVLAASGSGSTRPVLQTWSSVRRRPWSAVLAVLVSGLAAASVWAAALTSGFFVTGPVAAAATWLWTGACVAVVLACWSTWVMRAWTSSIPVPSGQ